MTPKQANATGFLSMILTIVAVVCMLRVADVSTDVIDATRVAHDETRAELADTYSELAMTLVELHECKNN